MTSTPPADGVTSPVQRTRGPRAAKTAALAKTGRSASGRELRKVGAPQRFSPDQLGTSKSPQRVLFHLGGKKVKGLDPRGTFLHKAKIQYQGSRSADFKAANAAVGLKKTPKDHTWHHFHDYSPSTGQGTMFLMRTSDHSKFHVGGVSQWEHHNKGKYG